MQIQPSGSNPAVKLSDAVSLESTGKAANRGEIKASEIAQSSYAPTSNLAKLLAAVRQLPEVRDDVVAEAADKLNSGELLTPQAANETALAAADDLK